MMTAELPKEIVNIDIINLCNLMNAGIQDIGNSGSSTVNAYSEADLTRAEAFMARLRRKFETDAGFPEVDAPKYAPRRTVFPQWPELKNEMPLQNTDAQDIINNLQVLYTEMAWSDSKERVAGFFQADANRVRVLMDKIDQNIADIRDVPENDLPDAADQRPHQLK